MPIDDQRAAVEARKRIAKGALDNSGGGETRGDEESPRRVPAEKVESIELAPLELALAEGPLNTECDDKIRQRHDELRGGFNTAHLWNDRDGVPTTQDPNIFAFPQELVRWARLSGDFDYNGGDDPIGNSYTQIEVFDDAGFTDLVATLTSATPILFTDSYSSGAVALAGADILTGSNEKRHRHPLFVAGELDDGVSVFSVAANGSLTNVAAGGNVTDVGALELEGVRSLTTAVVGGTTYLFAASTTDDGLSVFSVAGTGALTNVDNVPDDGTLELDFAISVTTAVIGATTFLFAAGSIDDGISVFSVAATGDLTNVDNVTDDATLNLNGVTSVATAVVGGTTYLFTGGGNSGISVFSVAANGTLTNEFNIADDATLNLTGVESITTAKIAGITYLFTASFSEDGVSVFAVADDGTLINVANVEDDGSLALSGAFDLHVAAVGGSAFLFVGGNADEGVSTFRIDVTGFTINGTGGNDTINALNSAPGELLPSELGDIINGLGGNDTLSGLGGNDVITGGSDRDLQFGGLGADRFDFNAASESKKGSQRDKINHFQRGPDDIDLRTIDAKTGVSGNQKFKFIGRQDFHDRKGELRYEDKGSKVIVQGDRNGDGEADFEIFVKVGALSSGDFLL